MSIRIDVTREDGHVDYANGIFTPLEVVCPRCEAPEGGSCVDLRYRRQVPRRPHAQRLHAGLACQGLTLQLIDVRWLVVDRQGSP